MTTVYDWRWIRTVLDKLFEANISDANILDENIYFLPNEPDDEISELLLFDAFEATSLLSKLR
jgi:hypothetical protein